MECGKTGVLAAKGNVSPLTTADQGSYPVDMNTHSSNEDSITPFAVTDFRDVKKLFGIRKRDRRAHMYVVGKTGTGKSTLVKNMLVSDIRKGEGFALIDPHGDLAESILHFVPQSRMEDIIFFNPADIEYPIAFNPLDNIAADSRYLVVSGLISIFKKIWPDYWGPRLEHILRYSLFTLIEYPNSTLLDLPRLLVDKDFRGKVLKHVQDPMVQEFWRFQVGESMKPDAIAPILNKTGQLLASVPVRNILGQARSGFDIREVMDEGKILIVNLAKGRIGEDNCSLLGGMLVSSMMLSAMSRANVPESERRPFYLYVDEVHNFLTPAFAEILSESRKYGLNLILAHQYLHQLDEKVRSAIFGNVGTVVSFRTGVEDASFFAREFQPVFDAGDLIGLANYHIYLKLMIDGATSKPFSAVTLPPPKAYSSYKREIIEYSRAKYARPRQEIEGGLYLQNSSAKR